MNLLGYFNETDTRRPDRELGPDELPFAVIGDRVLVIERPEEERTIGGLILPKESAKKSNSGILVHAGLSALDKMYDAGITLGDEVYFSMYAGVYVELRHVAVPGNDPDCSHDWKAHSSPPSKNRYRYKCTNCGAIKRVEPCVVLNVDDLLGSRELADRMRTGAMRVEFVPGDATTPNQHVIRR